MTRITLLRAADRKLVAWKNGGGVTEEVAVCPSGAGYADFLWRVSIATISGGSAFSILPGVRRVFSVLEGRLSIQIDGQSRDIDPHDPAIKFDGASTVLARPLYGPVRGLNLMMRKGYSGDMTRMSGFFEVSGDRVLLLAGQPTHICIGDQQWHLSSLDVIVLHQPCRNAIQSDAPLIAVEIGSSSPHGQSVE